MMPQDKRLLTQILCINQGVIWLELKLVGPRVEQEHAVTKKHIRSPKCSQLRAYHIRAS